MKKYLLNNLQAKLSQFPMQFELEFDIDKEKLSKYFESYKINIDDIEDDKFYNLAYFDYLTEENVKKETTSPKKIMNEFSACFDKFSTI